jgi:putative ABC transport system permease protein
MTRQKELAIRAALGASKARIVRQLLTESTLLACLGGAAGIVIALWGLDLVRTFIAGGMPRLKESVLDGNVLGFTWIVSLGTGILSGVAPAWMATRKSTYLPGRVDSSQSGHKLSRRFRHLLVVAEIASALALLASGGLLMQSFLRLRAVDPGFDEENVLTSQFELFSQRYEEKNARLAFYDELVENVAALPNVRGAALATSVPLQDVHFGYEFSIEGRSQPNRAGLPSAGYDCVIPEYFRVMGIRLVAGRSFTDADRPDTLPVVIINDTMARLFWPDDDPVGQRIRIRADQSSEDAPSIELVGVVESARTIALDRRARPEMFFPYSQRPWRSGFLILRLDAGATDVPASVRTAALAVDKDVALSDFRSMEDYLSTSVARPRFRTMLLAAFAALALVLASVGVYGVVGYSVSLRSHEIGIRVALGARPAEILRLFTREGLRLALIGVGIGLMAAFGLTRFLSSLLFGIEPTDGATLASASGLLVAITLLACYLPARHATRVDPLATLRSE